MDTWGETLEVDWDKSSLDFSKVAPPPKAPYFPFISVNIDLSEISEDPCAFSSSVLNPRTLTTLHQLHPAFDQHSIFFFFFIRFFSPPILWWRRCSTTERPEKPDTFMALDMGTAIAAGAPKIRNCEFPFKTCADWDGKDGPCNEVQGQIDNPGGERSSIWWSIASEIRRSKSAQQSCVVGPAWRRLQRDFLPCKPEHLIVLHPHLGSFISLYRIIGSHVEKYLSPCEWSDLSPWIRGLANAGIFFQDAGVRQPARRLLPGPSACPLLLAGWCPFLKTLLNFNFKV